MASGNDAITRMLDPTYLASRDIEQVRKTWNPILHQEMGRHWDMIKEGMKGFAFAHTEMVKVLAKYERDETAELVLHDFLDRMFPGALELLTQIGPYINQYPSCVTDEVILIIDDSDSRSVTMGPEPGSSRRPEPTTSMGPPPRPIGLLTPETPSRHRYGESSGDSGLSTIYDVPDSPPPDAAHGPLTLQQTAKRSLDTLDIEPAQSPGSPSKRAKKATGLQSVAPAKVTRTIDLWEVEGTDYIFKDKRCGHGWYVIRCNLGQQPGVNAPGKFVKNPLEGNTALNHFNDQSHTCHDTNRKWTIEDIIRECAHRVNGDGVTEERIRGANELLRKHFEQAAIKGSAKKPRKGKERATAAETGNGFLATNARAGTNSTDDSYKDSVSTMTSDQDVGDSIRANLRAL